MSGHRVSVRHRKDLLAVVAVIVAVCVFAAAGWLYVTLREQVSALVAANDANCQRAGSSCVATSDQVVRGAPGAPGPPGANGAPGRDGSPPSPQMVADAVAVYCAAHGSCRGADGRPTAPTAAQVAAAVGTYCAAHNKCQGDAGIPGTPGQPPSDDAVAAAVGTFCAAHGNCAGPPGKDGTDGAQGPPVAGWVWTDGGGRHECKRDPASPDNAPAYSCTTEPAFPPL